MSALTASKKTAWGKLIYIRTFLGSHLSMSDLVSGQSKTLIFYCEEASAVPSGQSSYSYEWVMLMLSANNVTDFINTAAMKHENSNQIDTYLKTKKNGMCV